MYVCISRRQGQLVTDCGVYVFLYFSGGVAVRGLYSTSPPAFENVMCPSNATSALDCSLSPPTSPRCFMNSSAAGVQCIYQGLSI